LRQISRDDAQMKSLSVKTSKKHGKMEAKV
jgi:hypothetical protein